MTNGNKRIRILVTGGAGGVGELVVRRFAAEGHPVRVFDLRNKLTEKVFGARDANIEVCWGDITDPESVRVAMKGIDEVFHLAGLVPPATETRPEIARKVNIEGTRIAAEQALKESENAGKPVIFRFSSTVAVFGITNTLEPPLPPDQPVNPCDTYSETKVEAEEIVRSCGLPWTIYRFSAAQYIKVRKENFSQMRIIPPDNRIEFVHIQDIADAFINSLDNEATLGSTFILAGGPRCRMLYKEQIMGVFNLLGFPEPDWSKFTDKPFNLDWYDTAEAQKVLEYQSRTYDDYLADFRKVMGWRYTAARYLASPIMKLFNIRL